MLGVKYNIDGFGTVESRYSDKTLHEVKSLAGTNFHKPVVKSVCVFDETGTARLYLKRTPDGVVREEN